MKYGIRVRVPATTANVGPGFDTLGIALQWRNTVELRFARAPQAAFAHGTRRNPAEKGGAPNMIEEAVRAFFRRTEMKERDVDVRIRGNVPIARGLGSSVTVRLGVVAGLNRLCGKPLKKQQALELVAELEGHPDNAAPALYGGLTVAGMMGTRVICLRRKLSEKLRFVAVIPDFEVETKKARELLPSTLPFKDAAHNVNRVALLVAALWDGEYEAVGDLLDDRLHQPSRAALVPQLFPAIEAAKAAGAVGGWLSGSGSAVMALALSDGRKVGQAMQEAFEKSGVASRVVVTRADNEGIVFD